MNQTARWSGTAGQAWIDAQAMLDELFRPFEDLLVAEVAGLGAGRVLDVGCGTGATTVAIARRTGTGGCVGVDIAEPMVAAARARAARDGVRVTFVHADAQEHAFPAAGFDAVVSRFGVMFFTDPVRAFANLRRAAVPGAALRAVVWRDAAQNPFMTTAERAAAPLLPDLPARRPDEPGQFGFAAPARVRAVLSGAGWTGARLRPVDVACVLPGRDLEHYFTRLGPLGLVLGRADAATRARVVDTVRAAFDPYVHGDEVRFTAACWQVDAEAPAG
ncbi:class I SAM-dependent methyltransferase [Dactylosporangium aurantiacum]|uniref:Class I SAM-dependent methyltransferase n=1 Tax=Dactylosporangium aurantiacum TaxID=35754 RepID=A0A9Q9I9J4_9ACTN|nr:class I SAM-dependent methyltransferase [Dactylosporangium aurantiacum]MDG6103590.1 class I SAM-dependent methyltransferase [Dactylosporangium aurantiacum]UWZ51917.1 class I SAM-dependent methyltransferase [Dactylosporangium aurantiacum]